MLILIPPDIPDSANSVVLTPEDNTVLLGSHQLKKQNKQELAIDNTQIVWPGLIALMVLSLFIFSYVRFFKKIKLWSQALFSLQYARTLEREDFKALRQPSFSMSLTFFFSAAFFMFQINRELLLVATDKPALFQFFILMLFLVFFFLSKNILHIVLGQLSDEEKLAAEYNFNGTIMLQAMGIFLIPVVIGLQFARIPAVGFLWAGGLVVACFFITQFIKGIALSLSSRSVSAFHVFLYLCLVEILPLLLLLKFFVYPS